MFGNASLQAGGILSHVAGAKVFAETPDFTDHRHSRRASSYTIDNKGHLPAGCKNRTAAWVSTVPPFMYLSPCIAGSLAAGRLRRCGSRRQDHMQPAEREAMAVGAFDLPEWQDRAAIRA